MAGSKEEINLRLSGLREFIKATMQTLANEQRALAEGLVIPHYHAFEKIKARGVEKVEQEYSSKKKEYEDSIDGLTATYSKESYEKISNHYFAVDKENILQRIETLQSKIEIAKDEYTSLRNELEQRGEEHIEISRIIETHQQDLVNPKIHSLEFFQSGMKEIVSLMKTFERPHDSDALKTGKALIDLTEALEMARQGFVAEKNAAIGEDNNLNMLDRCIKECETTIDNNPTIKIKWIEDLKNVREIVALIKKVDDLQTRFNQDSPQAQGLARLKNNVEKEIKHLQHDKDYPSFFRKCITHCEDLEKNTGLKITFGERILALFSQSRKDALEAKKEVIKEIKETKKDFMYFKNQQMLLQRDTQQEPSAIEKKLDKHPPDKGPRM